MSYLPCYMLGRLSNGFERDKGKLIHAVPGVYCGSCNGTGLKHEWVLPEALLKPLDPPQRCEACYGRGHVGNIFGRAFCRREPGQRSIGWELREGAEVTCPRCLAKIGGAR